MISIEMVYSYYTYLGRLYITKITNPLLHNKERYDLHWLELSLFSPIGSARSNLYIHPYPLFSVCTIPSFFHFASISHSWIWCQVMDCTRRWLWLLSKDKKKVLRIRLITEQCTLVNRTYSVCAAVPVGCALVFPSVGCLVAQG